MMTYNAKTGWTPTYDLVSENIDDSIEGHAGTPDAQDHMRAQNKNITLEKFVGKRVIVKSMGRTITGILNKEHGAFKVGTAVAFDGLHVERILNQNGVPSIILK